MWDSPASPRLLRGERRGLQVPACTARRCRGGGAAGGAVAAEICSPAQVGDPPRAGALCGGKRGAVGGRCPRGSLGGQRGWKSDVLSGVLRVPQQGWAGGAGRELPAEGVCWCPLKTCGSWARSFPHFFCSSSTMKMPYLLCPLLYLSLLLLGPGGECLVIPARAYRGQVRGGRGLCSVPLDLCQLFCHTPPLTWCVHTQTEPHWGTDVMEHSPLQSRLNTVCRAASEELESSPALK